MKIAKVFFTAKHPLPYPTDEEIQVGPFLPVKMAENLSPYMLIEVPFQRKVVPVLVILPQNNDAIFYSMQVLDISKTEEKGTLPDMKGFSPGALLPEHGIIFQDPPLWVQLMLKQAKFYWEPLTSKLAASEIASILHKLTVAERKDLLGDTRKFASKIGRENIFICFRWPTWAKNECSFEECSEDAKKHNLHLEPDNIRKRGKRLGLPSFKSMVE